MLTSVPLATLFSRRGFGAAKPNSTFAGVRVGMNVPYNYPWDDRPSADDARRRRDCEDRVARRQHGRIAVAADRAVPGRADGCARARARRRQQKAAADALRAWRLKSDPSKAAEVRKKFEAAGITSTSSSSTTSTSSPIRRLDYAFALAKAAGARAISCELEVEGVKRVGSSPTSTP